MLLVSSVTPCSEGGGRGQVRDKQATIWILVFFCLSACGFCDAGAAYVFLFHFL